MSEDGLVDGRVRRGQRTRGRIVEALLDLLTEGADSPTAQQIADGAGVSVRSVFQHFSDMESLYEDLVRAQTRRFEPVFRSLESSGDLSRRIDAIGTQRRELFELITPIRHSVDGRANGSPAIAGRLRFVSEALRAQTGSQFATELRAMEEEHRYWVLESLDLIWSFETWDRLRGAQGLSPVEAESILVHLCRSVFSDRDQP